MFLYTIKRSSVGKVVVRYMPADLYLHNKNSYFFLGVTRRIDIIKITFIQPSKLLDVLKALIHGCYIV